MNEAKIIEYFELGEAKMACALEQRYEAAAELRTKERELAREVYEEACGACPSGIEWKKYENRITEYCIEKYGVSAISRTFLRDRRLEQLGLDK